MKTFLVYNVEWGEGRKKKNIAQFNRLVKTLNTTVLWRNKKSRTLYRCSDRLVIEQIQSFLLLFPQPLFDQRPEMVKDDGLLSEVEVETAPEDGFPEKTAESNSNYEFVYLHVRLITEAH